MTFVSAVIPIHSEMNYLLTISDGNLIHKAVFSKVRHQNPELAHLLHDRWKNKGITISLVSAFEGEGVIRMSFIGSEGLEFLRLLTKAIAEDPLLLIGEIPFFCEAPDLNVSAWSRMATWGDLTAPTKDTRIRIQFKTPTAIIKRTKSGTRISYLYPDPETIYSGLAAKWAGFKGPALPQDLQDYLSSGRVIVSDFHLRTIDFKTTDRFQKGFTGFVSFLCGQIDTEYSRAITWLTRLAFFTGIGYQTARGMGAVEVSTLE